MTVPYDTASELASLAGVVLTAADLPSALALVTQVSVRAVPACDGCSLTMRTAGVPSAPVADGPWAADLDEAQFEEQEGPCLDCLREGTAMRVRDFVEDSRFPSYGPRAAQHGARSALSLPLAADGRTVGALNLYSKEVDAFGKQALGVGEILAAHASLAVQAAQAFFSHRDLAEQLRLAMESRAVIEQAKGILMAQHGVDVDGAFDLLVQQSQRSNRKLRDVATQVVADVVAGGHRP